MNIPANAIIPEGKLTDYLLVPRPWDDKSKFLARAGFTIDKSEQLEQAIRKLTTLSEAEPDGSNVYGGFYRVEGDIVGPNGIALSVVLIWLQWKLDGTFHFVTLKPAKGSS
jgi:hypothetical protein